MFKLLLLSNKNYISKLQVSPLKQTPQSKRKHSELEDPSDSTKRICITLWKDCADQQILPLDTSVVITNVYPKMFQQKQQLNSTQYTNIDVSILTFCKNTPTSLVHFIIYKHHFKPTSNYPY